jgi:hypothetical protein
VFYAIGTGETISVCSICSAIPDPNKINECLKFEESWKDICPTSIEEIDVVLNEKKLGGNVILSEELEFGDRIRDLTEISSSNLLAATDGGEIVILGIQK